ncbi:MAG: acyl-CoA thioesterase [Clostridia bacterium]|nr:acyl-CoA thioesterase [Clostridia bacterium]
MDIIYERKPFYYETDRMGIIHHSNYIRWFEEARIYYMEQMGYPYRRIEDEGIIIPVTNVDCNYKSMTRFGETVLIRVWLSKYNGAIFHCDYEVTDKETGTLRATGHSEHCFLDENGKVCVLKRNNPEAHEAFKNSLNK